MLCVVIISCVCVCVLVRGRPRTLSVWNTTECIPRADKIN